MKDPEIDRILSAQFSLAMRSFPPPASLPPSWMPCAARLQPRRLFPFPGSAPCPALWSQLLC